MLSHATTRDWLIPYADGMLAADERRRIDGHITGCPTCAHELREVRELNLLLVTLPPAPPVAFAPFWLNLQAVLPQRRVLRIPWIQSYRRLGVAFAMAATAALAAGGSAFAAPSALPDNPLYPVKQLEESVRLALAPTNERLAIQLELANERLREAQVMAGHHKPLLAENSLRAFRVTVDDAEGAQAILSQARLMIRRHGLGFPEPLIRQLKLNSQPLIRGRQRQTHALFELLYRKERTVRQR